MASISTEMPLENAERISTRLLRKADLDSRDGEVSYFEGGTGRLGVGNHGRVYLVHEGKVVDVCGKVS